MSKNDNEIKLVWEWAIKEMRRRAEELGNASELARQMGLEQSQCDKLLRGTRGKRPSAALVYVVLNGLGVSMRQLAKEIGLSEETIKLFDFQDKNKEILSMLADIRSTDRKAYSKIVADIKFFYDRSTTKT